MQTIIIYYYNYLSKSFKQLTTVQLQNDAVKVCRTLFNSTVVNVLLFS